MRIRMACLRVGVATAASLLPAAVVVADDEGFRMGLRGGQFLDTGPFLGAEMVVPLGSRLSFNPSVEETFAVYSNYTTLNGDLHFDFSTAGTTVFWVGAGVGLSREDFKDEQSTEYEMATNFLWGVGFRSGAVTPYLQGRVVRTHETSFSLGFGLRF